nr:transposase (putative), gypsy type [Tanacetum cinerariifolium]
MRMSRDSCGDNLLLVARCSHGAYQLFVLGAAKVSQFEIMCHVLDHQPSLGTFRRNRLIFVSWYNEASVKKDPFPFDDIVDFELLEKLNIKHTIIRRYPKLFLCLDGLSRSFDDPLMHLTLLKFDENDTGLLDFVKSADSFKVKTMEWTIDEGEVPLLTKTADMVTRCIPERFVVTTFSSKHVEIDVSIRVKSPLQQVEARNINVEFTDRAKAFFIPRDNAGTSTSMPDEGSPIDEFFEGVENEAAEVSGLCGYVSELEAKAAAKSEEFIALNKQNAKLLGKVYVLESAREELSGQVEAYEPEVENKYVTAVGEFENVSFSVLEELEALKDSTFALIMPALTLECDANFTPELRKLQPSLDQVTIHVYSEFDGPAGAGSISHEMLLSDAIPAICGRAENRGVRSFSSFVANGTAAIVLV